MVGCQWHELDHMQIICTSLPTDNLASTSSLNFFYSHMLFLTHNQQCQSNKNWDICKLWLQAIRVNQTVNDAQCLPGQQCPSSCSRKWKETSAGWWSESDASRAYAVSWSWDHVSPELNQHSQSTWQEPPTTPRPTPLYIAYKQIHKSAIMHSYIVA